MPLLSTLTGGLPPLNRFILRGSSGATSARLIAYNLVRSVLDVAYGQAWRDTFQDLTEYGFLTLNVGQILVLIAVAYVLCKAASHPSTRLALRRCYDEMLRLRKTPVEALTAYSTTVVRLLRRAGGLTTEKLRALAVALRGIVGRLKI